ncbi:MAG: 23S rRNA (adenine(2503)-C(2))-methyltransferase RlmN [candidate division Zixibacteria bacterium]|nr:23S rRNA (adenine(2503)-C(2))-methyltransferase RlmN [candidate division Zixibacteria bacterium]
MQKENLLGKTIAELEALMEELGEKRYKGRQLFKWLYNMPGSNFFKMSDLSKELRTKLEGNCSFIGLDLARSLKSADGTEKFLFALNDGLAIESVLIPDGPKRTVCISSQVGCSLGCKFCATGLIGFRRNLTVGEMVGQLLFLRQRDGLEAFHNIVFMGMGEPLLNYDNVVKTIEIISSELGFSVSTKKVTVSTVGIVPQIYSLADSGLKVNLAISLHATSDEKRKEIIPVARSYGLKALMESAKYFTHRRKKRVTFEYILFKGFNDTFNNAKELANLVKDIPCKINILAYNPVSGLSYRRPSDEEINEFGKLLYPLAAAVTVRKSRGLDIEAACGQLAGRYGKS